MTRLSRTSKYFIKLLCALFGVLLACVSLASCKSPIPVVQVVEKNTHDTIVMYDTKYDSVFHTDSVYEYICIKGDTVVREKLKYAVKYRYSIKHDSVYINQTDTIERPVYIEKRMSKWQELKLKYWWPLVFFSVLSISILIFILLWYIKKRL